MQANSLRILGCILSGPIDKMQCSGSSGGHEHDLLLQWEGLCSLMSLLPYIFSKDLIENICGLMECLQLP